MRTLPRKVSGSTTSESSAPGTQATTRLTSSRKAKTASGEATATLAGEAPPRLLHYGISDELGWEVGLACGGSVDIFVEPVRWDGSDAVLTTVRDAVRADRAIALLTVVSGDATGARAAVAEDGTATGSLGGVARDVAVAGAVRRHFASGLAGVEEVAGVSVFIDPIVP